jgi:hypothetical protein
MSSRREHLIDLSDDELAFVQMFRSQAVVSAADVMAALNLYLALVALDSSRARLVLDFWMSFGAEALPVGQSGASPSEGTTGRAGGPLPRHPGGGMALPLHTTAQ